ncbi:MAG: hypothetical protein E6R03_12930 [Hyphomicrobiaceae bacterium]|nr:MAG: hypothetical protein E6R03_12930 [Hyphomicrobiaceae bacterium]
MASNPEVVMHLEDMLKENTEILDRWRDEAKSEQGKMTVSLLQAINGPWYRWIKESGATSDQIIVSLIKVMAGMIAETAMNTAQKGKEAEMASVILKVLVSQTQEAMGIVMKEDALGEPLKGFRKRDA